VSSEKWSGQGGILSASDRKRVVVIGAGSGGLSAAIMLAASGLQVVVLERGTAAGGKIRQIDSQAGPIDAGPTVFTMRWVFEELFAAAGTSLTSHVSLTPLPVLARHAWEQGAVLDLFADLDASADAIGQFAGAKDAAGYRAFAARAQRIYAALEVPFLRAQQPGSALALVRARVFRKCWALPRFPPSGANWGGISRIPGYGRCLRATAPIADRRPIWRPRR
jgi:1-hydroxycarotenoid 3,4-desaturase